MTKAERLDRIVEKLHPEAHARVRETGNWAEETEPRQAKDEEGNPTGELVNAPNEGAPYSIEERGGQFRVRVTSSDGDVISGVGKTVEEAITALEQKVGGQ